MIIAALFVQMRLPFHISASQVTLLFLNLLCPIPHTVSTHLPSSAAFYPSQELESSLYDLRAPLQDTKVPKMWSDWLQDSLQILLEPEEVGGVWEEEQLLRDQREDVMDLPLSPFAADNSLEAMNYQDGEGEEGWKRNDALTSMAGGLQAVSREKGGFGFRFGRKRRLEKRRRDGGVIEGAGKQRRTRERRKRGFITEVWG
ncbi:uncharacterized protein LOC106699779 [Xiphophorus maculatus]|uniref:uncharacterized protein LOC106699779 n=1 Tax=Xiphophorus maculatus TaxID=8083 RepID=UPI0006D91220|nr:uncharacterized protein LOC106699779 [Xiphophorus maculatus]